MNPQPVKNYAEKLLTLVIALLIIIFLMNKDVAGFSAALSRYSQDNFYRVVGAIPWLSKVIYPPAAQNKITVVIISDSEDLPFLKTTWPVSYSIHEDILRSIAEKKPAAIFVDILFTDDRQDKSLDSFRKTLCEIVKSGIPIYLASVDPLGENRGIRSELNGCAKVVSALKPEDMEDGIARKYDLVFEKQGAYADSPALALYLDYVKNSKEVSEMTHSSTAQMQIYCKRATNYSLFRKSFCWLNPWHANSTATVLQILPASWRRAGYA